MPAQLRKRFAKPGPERTAELRFLAELPRRLDGEPDPLSRLEVALREVGPYRLRSVTEGGDTGPGIIAGRDGAAAALIEGSGATPDFLRAVAGIASLALARAQIAERLSAYEHIGREIEGAAELQQSLQPDNLPDDLPIWGINLPARKLSGDFFDYYRLDDQRIAFALGDVSGKRHRRGSANGQDSESVPLPQQADRQSGRTARQGQHRTV